LSFIFDLFNKKHKNHIISVQELTLRIIGMRVTNLYKIEDAGLKLERYRELYRDGEVILELEKSAPCETDTLVGLMNECGIIKWDGFYGKHPKNVSDGTMFAFTATINNGRVIRADGSQNFPKGYREFVRALDKMLAE